MLLPAELIDKIFSFLQKDTSALKACSKAHPLYARLAERHLYTHIVVSAQTASDLLDLLNENSHFLDYPRTLEISSGVALDPTLFGLSIMALIPRMTNLRSLKLTGVRFSHRHHQYIPTLKSCLQQSSIERLCLSSVFLVPFSVLDNSKTIKTLTLSNCIEQGEPISSVSSSQNSLETLILSGVHIPNLRICGMHRFTRLTSLGLHGYVDLKWPAFPELLTACSNSLTTLHFVTNHDYSSLYSFGSEPYFHGLCCFLRYEVVSRWIHNPLHFPFTLSVLTRLKSLSIFGIIGISARIEFALPEIIRLINTAPAIQHVVLSFHCQCYVAGSISSLGLLDWSLLDLVQSNSAGTRPRIELCITGEYSIGLPVSAESILDALAGSEVLMGLVARDLVILKSERALALWDD